MFSVVSPIPLRKIISSIPIYPIHFIILSTVLEIKRFSCGEKDTLQIHAKIVNKLLQYCLGINPKAKSLSTLKGT